MQITKYMKTHRIYFDGAIGSLLQARGLKSGELPETWNILHPDALVEIHRAYLEAGSNIITTNTFGANALKYPSDGDYPAADLIKAAVKNANTARAMHEDVFRKEHNSSPEPSFVALDLGPTGKLLAPYGELPFEDAVSLYADVIKAAGDAIDLILIETMTDTMEMKAAVLAAKENSSLPVFATMTFDEDGRLLTGGTIDTAVALLEGLHVDALGINCGLGPDKLKDIIIHMCDISSTPVIFNPNAGLPRIENGKTVYDISSDEYVQAVKEVVDATGIAMIGGCCGTTPEYISKLKKTCGQEAFIYPENKNRTVISSNSRSVVIGNEPVLIGERINPTGKKRFRRALIEHDMDYILREGMRQKEAGADVLDVNVGLPEIDEPAMLRESVSSLQSTVDLPLQIDTSDPVAMERALRICEGKPLINSVNGKEESLISVLPLAAKYGGVLVALPLDESGIPDTAKGRLEIAERILRRAAAYGIDKKDIIVDGLCMAVSAVSDGAIVTLNTLRLVRRQLGVGTILGVSNISFGLPMREHINAAFFTMAMQEGLSAAIINPLDEEMMRAYLSFRVLKAYDRQCEKYISVYAPEAAERKKKKAEEATVEKEVETAVKKSALYDSIIHGLKTAAIKETEKALQNNEAMDVINFSMIPALDRVGKEFGAGRLYLPQLLMSAEAAKAAFEVIRQKTPASAAKERKKGKVILATVRGDIHDIGKNIVKVLLENYSYDVIDLGRDVPPELITKTAIEEHVPVVGLSALMTTTVPSMEETIKMLHEKAPDVKIMVGGAVMTEECAGRIGADRYCSDAMESVRFSEEVLNHA